MVTKLPVAAKSFGNPKRMINRENIPKYTSWMRFTRQLCDGMSQIFKLELLNEFQKTLSGMIWKLNSFRNCRSVVDYNCVIFRIKCLHSDCIYLLFFKKKIKMGSTDLHSLCFCTDKIDTHYIFVADNVSFVAL